LSITLNANAVKLWSILKVITNILLLD